MVRRTHARMRRTAAIFLLATSLTALFLLTGAPPQAQAVPRGIVDGRLENIAGVDLEALPGIVDGMGPSGLHGRWTRVSVSWGRLQPTAPDAAASSADLNGDGYVDSYVNELDAVVAALRGAGMTVVMTATDVPKWASDRRYWTRQGYDPDVAMRIDNAAVRAQFARFGQFLASRFAGQVRLFECWNEPNLGSGIFPQRRGKKDIGPSVYFKMLKAFYVGVKRGSSRAIVIAGATAPRGANNQYSTSPQRFARYLRSQRATKWFNAYSHHPYTPGGSRNAAPDRPPNNPSRCVTLYNLNVLMKLFPGKPFYLTEFAYNTRKSELFGLKVSPADQARYLRKAYSMVARWPRVKALLWYNVVDWGRGPAHPADGVYCGLIESNGVTRKPGWYAFAGGNRLTVKAPASVKARQTFSVSGTLTTRLGPGEAVKVMLQGRNTSRGKWSRVATTRTVSDGAYSFTTQQKRTKLYRVVWDGVCESAQKKVRTP